jgi:hypothetical protein
MMIVTQLTTLTATAAEFNTRRRGKMIETNVAAREGAAAPPSLATQEMMRPIVLWTNLRPPSALKRMRSPGPSIAAIRNTAVRGADNGEMMSRPHIEVHLNRGVNERRNDLLQKSQ